MPRTNDVIPRQIQDGDRVFAKRNRQRAAAAAAGPVFEEAVSPPPRPHRRIYRIGRSVQFRCFKGRKAKTTKRRLPVQSAKLHLHYNNHIELVNLDAT